MKTYKNYSLLRHNTFGIDQRCDMLAVYASVDDAVDVARSWAATRGPLLILGGGSNLLLTQDFRGLVATPEKRFDVEQQTVPNDGGKTRLRCWAGTCFDEVVAYAVARGLCGMENLSLIPGECGASAVQNIGAYGVEAKDIIIEVEAVELETGRVVTLAPADCDYGYRMSRFKREWRDKFLITHVTYELSRTFVPHLDYGNIRAILESARVDAGNLTVGQLRETIIGIRRAKLPDPEELGNAGSFFMNPMVDEPTFRRLQAEFPGLHYFEVPGPEGRLGYKIPAGWMIEQSGWKGKSLGRAGVYDKQALVLVNRGGATGAEVVALMEAIQQDVERKFGLHIQPEVNIK
ncbi:UDP-N-acetylmuramate dehydrogenase [[Hallella] seregens]|uniref:UDP-N-acetylenolpyruvoylglucosamine reductase n=1 Tax=Hallella seregens ATCC 51272 TaxID=1336250 RepID=A0ABV5ZJ45_9BACT|nr:UDP-N-acetylmuramate dehydrogenase [Hallella seregens]